MSTVQNNTVSSSLLASMNPAAAATQSTAAAAQDTFMKLLVTQMKNQDPLNPLDNAQVTSQLAQLSTVTGIEKMNTTLQSLMGSYQSSQTLQAAGMIGHGVLVAGSSLNLTNGQAPFGIDLATSARRCKSHHQGCQRESDTQHGSGCATGWNVGSAMGWYDR